MGICPTIIPNILGPNFEETLKGMGAIYLNYKDENYARDLISLSGTYSVRQSDGNSFSEISSLTAITWHTGKKTAF